ncbi:MAG: hypothetical protein HFI09_02840 [Bacilli bacterium]|nr:hypothetical protein [Bacilli bacterium]
MKIHDLLYLERKNEHRREFNPMISGIILLLSITIGIFALIHFDHQFVKVGQEPSLTQIFLSIILLIISIYGITLTISNFLLNIVLKHQQIKYRKDNLFVARIFSSKVKTMSITLGTLTILITLTLVALNISSLFKGMFEYQIKQNAPYDISINVTNRDELPMYMKKIEDNYTIKEELLYHSYTDSNNNIRKKLSEDYYLWHQQDTVIKLSDYNKLMALKKEPALELKEDEYFINCAKESCDRIKEQDVSEFITKEKTSLKLKDITNQGFDYTLTGFAYFVVVPDRYAEEEIVDTILTVNTLEKTTEAFAEDLMSLGISEECHQENNIHICYSTSNVTVKGKEEATNKSFMTITSFICFYIALIFTAVVGTILAIQALSESCDYKYRYTVLKRLGVKESECLKSIRKQLSLFFLFPLVVPCIISFSTLRSMNKIFQITLRTSSEYLNYFLLNLLLFLSVYLLYLIATYFGYKKNIEE